MTMETVAIVLTKIIDYRGNLCYIPEENECFREMFRISIQERFLSTIS